MKQLNKQLAQEIVDRTMQIIGRNINVMNESGVIIGSGDLIRIDQIHEGALTVIKTKEGFEISEENHGGMHAVKPGINLPISFQNKVVGVVGITGPPDEIRSYGELVKMAAEMILQQAVLIDQLQWDDRLKEELVSQLIHSEGELDSLFFDRAKRLSINLVVPRVAIVISASDRLAVLKILKLHLEPEDLFLMQPENIVILKKILLKNQEWNRNETLHTVENWLDRLHILKNSDTKISVGDFDEGFQGLSQSYYQAKVTLEVGMKLDSEQSTYLYQDYHLPVFIANASPHGNLKKFKPYYAALEEHDKNGELIETLHTYIEENGDINNVVKKMYIHRNTLRYRLDRITEISGKDPRKVKDLMDLYLSYLSSKIN
jgi:carbohydrate diacid regulator